MEKLVKERGFESLSEFNALVSSVDISSFEKMSAFNNWREYDGTKDGLLKLSFVIERPIEQWKTDYISQIKKMSNTDLLTSYTTMASTDSDSHTNRYEFCWMTITEELETRLKSCGFLK